MKNWPNIQGRPVAELWVGGGTQWHDSEEEYASLCIGTFSSFQIGNIVTDNEAEAPATVAGTFSSFQIGSSLTYKAVPAALAGLSGALAGLSAAFSWSDAETEVPATSNGKLTGLNVTQVAFNDNQTEIAGGVLSLLRVLGTIDSQTEIAGGVLSLKSVAGN